MGEQKATPAEIYEAAYKWLGLTEIVGPKHEAKIIEMFHTSGHSWVNDDETPWCAAFVGHVLVSCGLVGTRSLAARSYETWGEPVSLDKAQKGDIVVFWRKSPGSGLGHVGFYHGHDTDSVYVLGGNQSNAVNISPYKMSRLVAVRRARAPRKSIVESKTVQGTAVAAGGAAGLFAYAGYFLDFLDRIADMDPSVGIPIFLMVMVILGLVIVFRERWIKWFKEGDR